MTGGIIYSREASGNLVIESKDIVSFHYEFTTNSIIYRGYNIPYEYCSLFIEKELEHATVNIYMDGYESVRLNFTVDIKKLLLLQDLVEKENIAAMSGTYKKTAGIPADVGSELSIKYASDEKIYAYDNTGHVLPNLTTSLIYDFFRELALEASQVDYASKQYRLRSNQEYEVITRGKWLEKQGNFSLEFYDNKLKISEGSKIIYDDSFSISIGIILNQEGKTRFGSFYYIYVKQNEIILKEFGQADLIFSPGEDYFIEMIQGSWLDEKEKYQLDFKDSRLKIHEDSTLILDEEISLEIRSIKLKDKKDKNIGPFRNLYADIGYIQVLPYVGEKEDKRIIFYPLAD